MKRGLVILLFSCLCAVAYGKGDLSRFTFGCEWTYCATVFSGHRYYYIAPEGYRIEDRDNAMTYVTDGEAYLHVGYNIDTHWNLSLYAGYTGIGNFHNGIPVSIRATRFFGNDPLKDRWFAYCDVGSGFSMKTVPSELITGKIGGGYRMSLSRISKLDFIASLRFVHTHPDIYYYGEKVEPSQISRNSGYIMSASVGIGLTF